jgi:hypothetical protein
MTPERVAMTERDEIPDLADRIRERQWRGEDFELEFEIKYGALADDERDEFNALMAERIAQGGEVLEAVEANVRVLKALLILQVEEAPGMSLTEAIGSHIGVMEIVETIRRTDVT